MKWLADTNVLSDLARPRPNPGVLAWSAELQRISISAITIDEIAYGLSWRPNAKTAGWLARFFAESCDVLPVTASIAQRAGTIRGQLRARGSTRAQADMLIAATAQIHGLTLVTRNVRDFDGCQIELLNPFV
jgi:predicted nucleic acid-binding protein